MKLTEFKNRHPVLTLSILVNIIMVMILVMIHGGIDNATEAGKQLTHFYNILRTATGMLVLLNLSFILDYWHSGEL